jgi:hypothetical protein
MIDLPDLPDQLPSWFLPDDQIKENPCKCNPHFEKDLSDPYCGAKFRLRCGVCGRRTEWAWSHDDARRLFDEGIYDNGHFALLASVRKYDAKISSDRRNREG